MEEIKEELNKQTKEAKDIVSKIKRIMFNCDLTLVYANSEIKIREAQMQLYEGDKRKSYQQKYIYAKIDKERFEIFVLDIERVKEEITENLNIVLDKYQPRYKQIFYLFFMEDKSYQEIADLTNYSLEAIKVIIRKLKNDIITLYLP